jgi:polysaccharide biosynthesis/export protein
MTHRTYWIRPISLLAFLAGVSFVAQAQEPAVGGYVVQAGDLLQISVWKEEDLQRDVLVLPDGVVSFPLVGNVGAAGRTVGQISKAIAEQLDKYVPDAVVTVSVKATGGNRYYIIGKVARPGEFPLNGPLDVIQALSIAGGGTSFADLNAILILRRTGDKQTVLRFRYRDVAKGRELSQNIQLQTGDTIVVP